MTALTLESPTRLRGLKVYSWTLLTIMLLPAAILIPLSFSADAAFVFPPRAYSLRWYERLWDQSRWRDAALLSLQVAALAALVATLLGSPAAIGLARLPPRLARSFRQVFIAPLIVPLMVLGVALYFQFAALRLLGSVWSLVLAHTVLVMPFVMITVSARLVSLDPALERAAHASGAGPWKTLARVVLPLLAPAMAAGAAFAFIFSFDEVVIAQFLAGPRLETLPRRLWEGIAIGGLENTITAVTSLQIAIALIGILMVEGWTRRRWNQPAGFAADVSTRLGPSLGLLPAAERGGAAIEFEAVIKRFGDHAAVDCVSLRVEPGEFLTVLGPSGSGKTTLLMLLAGFTGHDSGRILVEGRDIGPVAPHRRDIGVVFQSYALFPHLDVRRNVAFPLSVRGLPRAEIDRRVDEMLHLVRLEAFSTRRITQLSGGQQQRVALARAIVFRPRVLLMDEPLAALDRNLRLDMQIEIKRLHRALGQTVIYVTHDQEEALNLSDRIAIMHSGQMQQVGSPKELYLKPANTFVAGFFGATNLFRGIAAGACLVCSPELALRLPEVRHGRIAASLRPESIELLAADASRRGELAGTVVEVTFQGSVMRLLVAAAGRSLVVTKPSTSPAAAFRPGDAVLLDWDLSALHLMEDEA